MRKFNTIIALFLIVLFTSCSLIGNISVYKAKTKDFVEAILHQDYDKGISLLDQPSGSKVNKDTLKAKLVNIRDVIVKNFGSNLDYTFETASKTFSTDNSASTPPDQTLVLIQISNGKEFGELKLLFNDKSQKIASFNVEDVKEDVPNTLFFWLFGILVFGVLSFNIYTIVQVKRSAVKKKWLNYLAIIFLNLPTIGYKAVGGLFFSASIQLFFGISFAYMGYINYLMAFGIPVGALLVFYRLKKKSQSAPVDDMITGGTDIETNQPEQENN